MKLKWKALESALYQDYLCSVWLQNGVWKWDVDDRHEVAVRHGTAPTRAAARRAAEKALEEVLK